MQSSSNLSMIQGSVIYSDGSLSRSSCAYFSETVRATKLWLALALALKLAVTSFNMEKTMHHMRIGIGFTHPRFVDRLSLFVTHRFLFYLSADDDHVVKYSRKVQFLKAWSCAKLSYHAFKGMCDLFSIRTSRPTG